MGEDTAFWPPPAVVLALRLAQSGLNRRGVGQPGNPKPASKVAGTGPTTVEAVKSPGGKAGRVRLNCEKIKREGMGAGRGQSEGGT